MKESKDDVKAKEQQNVKTHSIQFYRWEVISSVVEFPPLSWKVGCSEA